MSTTNFVHFFFIYKKHISCLGPLHFLYLNVFDFLNYNECHFSSIAEMVIAIYTWHVNKRVVGLKISCRLVTYFYSYQDLVIITHFKVKISVN
jgi:hypothetical protein